MLVHLSIRDIVLIDKLDIDFAPQLTALTGETGAGKSIVLDAFTLALGARGDSALVRQGAEQGQVVAMFEVKPGHPAFKLLKANGLDADGELILRRVQLADGRTRAFINDQPVTVQVLREVGQQLVEIHGQHDERALVDAATHRALLDAFGGNVEASAEIVRLWDSWKECEQAADAERERMKRAMAEADFIRHAVEELSALAPQPGEEQTLADRRAALMRAEKAADDLRDAHEAVAGSASPVPTLSAVLRRLERRNADAADLVGGPVKALDLALQALEEARAGLESALRIADFDPEGTGTQRGAAVRIARGGAQIQRDRRGTAGGGRALSGGHGSARSGIEVARGSRGEGGEAEKAFPGRGRGALQGAGESGEGARQGGECGACAAEARARGIHHPDRKQARRAGAGRFRPGGVLGADQSGLEAGAP
jgi:DNA repair ATPase RecN